MGSGTAVLDLNASSSIAMHSDVCTTSASASSASSSAEASPRFDPAAALAPPATYASIKPARAARWNGSHVSFAAEGLPNAPSSLTATRATVVSASSSVISSRRVPLRPRNFGSSGETFSALARARVDRVRREGAALLDATREGVANARGAASAAIGGEARRRATGRSDDDERRRARRTGARKRLVVAVSAVRSGRSHEGL
eukprot:31547-Pelagococcus_subviridis.AAC.2